MRALNLTNLSPDAGSQFSMLLPEIATNNGVKGVRRMPVRVELDAYEFDEATPLPFGLSAEVSVDARHHRAVFGNDAASVAHP